jgi:hypothetical protein
MWVVTVKKATPTYLFVKGFDSENFFLQFCPVFIAFGKTLTLLCIKVELPEFGEVSFAFNS